MSNANEISHKEKKIFYIDFSNLKPEDMLTTIEDAKSKIATYPEQSLLILTNATNARFDRDVSNELKTFTKANTPYVKASAIIGITGLQKIIYQTIVKVTGRTLKLFDEIDSAKDWLVEQL